MQMERIEPTVENKEDVKHAPGSAGEKRDILQDIKIEDYDYLANSAAGMDCTGLMNRTPVDEAEMASYQQTYQYLPPNVKVDAPKASEKMTDTSEI